MNKSYFYLDMKTHELLVPYSQTKRRVRVLLPKNYSEDLEKVILLFIFMMDKMFFIVKSLSAVIPGRLFQLSNAILI